MTQASTTPGASLPDGWQRTDYDEIGNAAGYRIHKNHVATATGVHPVYHAFTPHPGRGYLGAFPQRADAVSACEAFEARRRIAHL